MPIKPENKALYPPYWRQLSKYIREERAGNKCESCGVENRIGVFRCTYEGRECYQTFNGDLYDANTSELIARDTENWDDLTPTGSNLAIKVILTVAHLDHNPVNSHPSNLKALCQRCHNRHDAKHRAETRRNTKNIFSPTLF